ncbi:hypothetical protein [Roseibium algae]|uniref:Glycerophosphoryl diester phosphodiesterase membrane domain-containing protein n=1 Tax=Roseibium algae TaxID=3123038 RepID=A0ABU8TNV6_9HYPH
MFKRIIRDSFTLVFGNLETVFKACGAWFVIQFVLIIATQMTIGGSGEFSAATVTEEQLLTPAGLIIALLTIAFGFVSSASIAVAWHRFGLLGDQPGLIHLTVGPTEGRFIVKSILIVLIAGAVLSVIGIVSGLLAALVGSSYLFIILWVLACIFFLPYFMRLNLVLPAVAIERPVGFKDAYELGEGLGWGMVGAALVLSLPFIVINMGLQFLLGLAEGGLPLILIQFKVLILNLLLQIIVTILGISVITAGYRIAMERANGRTAS